jgi:sec-independent protein translocase protein TatA
MGTIIMIGGQEIFLVMIVALVLFGADKIPDLAKGLGKGMREFKKASDDIMAEINNSTKDIRKDITDVTDSFKQDMDKVTGSIMNQMNDVTSTVQQNINEVSTNMTNVAASVQQNIDEVSDEVKKTVSFTQQDNIEYPQNFNDSSEAIMFEMKYGYPPPHDIHGNQIIPTDRYYADPVTGEPVAFPPASETQETVQPPVDVNNISEAPTDETKKS